MNLWDDDWLDYVTWVHEGALTYVKTKGFEGHDLDGLAFAKPLGEPPPESGVSKSDHLTDPRPRAEIVATAWVVQGSYALITHAKQMRDGVQEGEMNLAIDDHDRTCRIVFTLGKCITQAAIFIDHPGQSADNAVPDERGLVRLFGQTNELANKEVYRQDRQKAGLKKAKEAISPIRAQRDKALCATGLELRAAGIPDTRHSTPAAALGVKSSLPKTEVYL